MAPTLLALAAAGTSNAQSIKGNARDANGPLRNASIVFNDTRLKKPMRATTDSSGDFVFGHVQPATFTLGVESAGRQWTTLPYEIGPKENLTVELQLGADRSTAVAHIETDRSKYLTDEGFYHRLQTLHGSFFTRQEIEASGKQALTQLLGNVRGVRVVSVNGGKDIVFRSAVSAGLSPNDGSTAPRVALDESTPCHPTIYVNGSIARPSSLGDPQTVLDDVEAIDNVEAIELYQVTDVPPQFTRFNESCGAVVIWRRRGM